MKSKLFFLIFFSLSTTVFSQQIEQPEETSVNSEEESELDLVHIQTINNKVYQFRIRSEGSTFQMKICKSAECKELVEYLKAMNPDTFVYAVMVNINEEFSESLTLAIIGDDGIEELKEILNKVKDYDEKKVRETLSEVQNRLRTIETAKDNYSGVLVLNTKKVPYQITTFQLKSEKREEILAKELILLKSSLKEKDRALLDSLEEESILKQYLKLKAKNGIDAFILDDQIKKIKFEDPRSVYFQISTESNQYEKFDNKDFEAIKSNGTGELKVKSATVQFFNNKAATIKIRAQLKENDITYNLSFINSDFSVPIRYFNKYGSTVSALLPEKGISGKRVSITIDYNDVFEFESFGPTFSNSVANHKVELKIGNNNDKSHTRKKIPERRFFDFFSGIIYSDLMGFNTESSNSLVNVQARILLPLNLRNSGKNSFIRQLTAVTNIALQNSFDDENRFININDSDKFNNFDLLRKNNLYGKLSLEILTHEAKGFFTNIGVGYSAGFYRTGFRLTQTENVEPDVTLTKQLLSIGHGPYLNFEIRPQSNFGADVTFSLEDLNYAGENSIGGRSFSDDLISNKGKDHFVMPYNLINLEANFYWLTNPETSVGGVYAKLGTYFHTDTNSIFPQFMVGYATNLTSFVDKFKSATSDKAEELTKED